MILKFLLFVFFALLPRYFFPSGDVQPVDVVIIILMVAVTIKKRHKIFDSFSIYLLPFMPYLFWLMILGLFFQINDTSSFQYIISFIQFYYFYLILFLFFNIFSIVIENHDLPYLCFCLLIGVLSPFIVVAVDFNNRNSLSFNNPNQLGYYAILMFTMTLIILNKKKVFGFGKFVYLAGGLIIIVCHIMAFLCVSRSSLFATGLLDLILLLIVYKNINLGTKIFITIMVGLILSFGAALWQLDPLEIKGGKNIQSNTPLKRFEEKKLFDEDDFQGRFQFLNKYNDSTEILIGTSGRLNKKNLEVHNAVLGIFYNYGVIGGFLFFSALALTLIKLKFSLFDYIFFIPIGLYNMSHYGLRFRCLWVTLAFLLAIHLFEKSKRHLKSDLVNNGFQLEIGKGL